VLLAACATPAERELHKVSLASEKLWAEYDICMARVEGTGAYRRLNQDYIMTRNDPRSVEKMAIERPAGDQERADLLQNHKNETRCNQELFKGFAEINPGFNVLLSRFMSEDDELILQTIQGKLTVGSRNRIVQQRFAQRLRDWNFASERIVRLHTWRLRRTCSIYCSSFSAASLMPTSTAGVANLAGVTPLPPTAGLAAGLPPVVASPDAAAPAAQLAAVPAASTALAAPTAQIAPTAQTAQTAPAAPAALAAPTALVKPTAQPSAQSPAPAPVTAAAPAAVAQPTTAAKPSPPAPTITPLPGAPKPEAAAAAAASEAETARKQAGEETRPALAAKPERAAAPAARETNPAAESESRATASALAPPAADAETGLKPAAGPNSASTAQKKQPAQLASTAEKAERPVYTVHLASMDSEVEARAEWGTLQARYPAILGDRVLFTREVTIGGKGTFVRVLTGLFHDRAQAKALCGTLGGGDQYCAILKL
jgi:hypothetical protein